MTDHLTWEGERAPFAKAFIAAQQATEAVKKASTNPAFKSRYADLAVVVEAVIPALNESGIAVIQSPSFDGDLVSVTTMLLHESGASITGTLSMRPTKMDPQGVGSAITYSRRYALLAMTGAAPEDDDGQAASVPAPANQPRRDSGPGPVDGKDFYGCSGQGISAHAAKKDGLDNVLDVMRQEIDALPTTTALREWIEKNREDIAPMPQSWRSILREECDTRAKELGFNPDQKVA